MPGGDARKTSPEAKKARRPRAQGQQENSRPEAKPHEGGEPKTKTRPPIGILGTKPRKETMAIFPPSKPCKVGGEAPPFLATTPSPPKTRTRHEPRRGITQP